MVRINKLCEESPDLRLGVQFNSQHRTAYSTSSYVTF
jgi:hypothetical protein